MQMDLVDTRSACREIFCNCCYNAREISAFVAQHVNFETIFFSKQLIFFHKSSISKNDKTATREWPPTCVDSTCSNLQLFKGETFDFQQSKFEAVFLGLGVVYSCDFCVRDSPQSVITRQKTSLRLNTNYSLYTLVCLWNIKKYGSTFQLGMAGVDAGLFKGGARKKKIERVSARNFQPRLFIITVFP